ncbi:DUF6148 family protein [Pseudomonas marginalis]|jgi:hypothetical protein|uniref:DUF6148 family protein n=1 Tax=Pseudomonas marginalis TaxID=298 RepID=UPI002B1CAFED|nr:DUF6148 family protein [Pseudomonas marginalis]
MAITLEQAQGQLQAWLDASMKVSQKQSYRIGTRQLEYADLAEITKTIDYWQQQIDRLESGRTRGIVLRGITPR